ncbi:MAG: nucleotidyltransferase domain-containing protein [Thermotogota bacterium]|nr:nucleotidyltransferase domain-containing protein [Thermotogota bacterium]
MRDKKNLFICVNEDVEEEELYFYKTKNKKLVYELLKELLDEKKEVILAYIYGSFNEKEIFGDIDIAVVVDPLPSNTLSYELDLSYEIESTLNIPIDVKVINNAPVDFAAVAISGTLLLSKNEEKRVDFEFRIMRDYLDRKSTINYIKNLKDGKK